ncbi:MAG: hypothetical protein ACOY15_01690 [Pseudomonadota bacterium]
MLKILFGATVMLLGACAQQNVISHVNQRPLFQPSLISYAARDGAVPLEIHGALPAGMSAQEIAQGVRLPGRTEGVRLISEKPIDAAANAAPVTPVTIVQDRVQSMIGAGGHNFRIVLVFGPHIQTLPDRVCDAADKIPTSSSQDVRVLAAYCIGAHLAASGQMRVPANAAEPASTIHAINLLLSDMSKPPAENGFGSGSRRH